MYFCFCIRKIKSKDQSIKLIPDNLPASQKGTQEYFYSYKNSSASNKVKVTIAALHQKWPASSELE